MALINGEAITLNAPAIIQGDRVLVPLRFIAESLDCEVDWVDAIRRVIVETK